MKLRSTMTVPSRFCTARMGAPAATRPTIGISTDCAEASVSGASKSRSARSASLFTSSPRLSLGERET